MKRKNTKQKVPRLFFLATTLLAFCFFYSLYDNTLVAHADDAFVTASNASANEASKPSTWSPVDWLVGEVGDAIKGLLIIVLEFASRLLSLSGVIFASMVDADIVNNILTGPAVYETWKIVRDFLNILFILVLLFSAFSTVFQVEKYNYKKILLTLVLMALLVNFSFPITRFIIDVSNSLMYTLLGEYFGKYANNGGGILAAIADGSQLATILSAGQGGDNIAYLISAIVFVFILAITFLAIGVLLIIRVVMLALLIIFSPIAFVGSIVPGYLSSKAGEWWDNLFKYSFFGPIMIFMIFVATKMTVGISMAAKNPFDSISQNNTMNVEIISAMAYFAIPIVILWIGMGIAQSMSIAGAGAVMGQAKKWGGKTAWWLARNPALGTMGFLSKQTGMTGAAKDKWKDTQKKSIITKHFGADAIAGRVAKRKEMLGMEGSVAEHERKEVHKIREEWKKAGNIVSEKELLDLIKEGGVSGKAAAIQLAEQFGIQNYTTYKDAKKLVASDPNLSKLFDDSVKKKRLDFVISYKMENPKEGETALSIAEKELSGIDSVDLKKIDFKEFFKNTKDAKTATENYFKSINPRRKLENAKGMGAVNEAMLETEGILQKREQPQDQKPKKPIGFNR